MKNENREIINPEKIHDPIGFTHVTVPKGNKLVLLSVQVAWVKDMNVVEVDDLVKQTDMVYQNIEHVLNEVGATWDHIVKTTVYTTMPNEYEIIGAATAQQNTLEILHLLPRQLSGLQNSHYLSF